MNGSTVRNLFNEDEDANKISSKDDRANYLSFVQERVRLSTSISDCRGQEVFSLFRLRITLQIGGILLHLLC